MSGIEEVAKKVYEIIVEKKPRNLSMTFYDGKWKIYTDEGLVAEIEEKEEEEARVKKEEKPGSKSEIVKELKEAVKQQKVKPAGSKKGEAKAER